jgi:hypothetical protein
MLNKTSILLAAAAAIALSAGTASAQPYPEQHAQRTADVVSVDVNGIAFGYRDGYWDNGHHWHKWQDKAASSAYRSRTDAHYNDYNHDRDPNMGWQR